MDSELLRVQGVSHAERLQPKRPLTINWAIYGRSGTRAAGSHKLPNRAHEVQTDAEQRNSSGATPMVPPTPKLSHGTRAEASPPDAAVSFSLPNGHSANREGEEACNGNGGARASANGPSALGPSRKFGGEDHVSAEDDFEEGRILGKLKTRDGNAAGVSGEVLDGSSADAAVGTRELDHSPESPPSAPPDKAKKATPARTGKAAKGRAPASPSGVDAGASAESPAPGLTRKGNTAPPGTNSKPAAGSGGDRVPSADAASVRHSANVERQHKVADHAVPNGVELDSAGHALGLDSSGGAGGHSTPVEVEVVEVDGSTSMEQDHVGAEHDARGDTVTDIADAGNTVVEREGDGTAVPMEVDGDNGNGDATGASQTPLAGGATTDGTPGASSVRGGGCHASATSVDGAAGLPSAPRDKVPARSALHAFQQRWLNLLLRITVISWPLAYGVPGTGVAAVTTKH